MCGIIGSVGAGVTDTERFDAARDLMRHRGPDDGASLHAPPVHLGARRLAIQDLSPVARMPMRSDDGRLAVTFNGEIYNFRELRTELSSQFQFRSGADTEVLLHGYRAWGWDGLLRRIDGMFAFALWDADRRELLFARDRVGKKPLYYARTGGGLQFASTIAALLGILPSRPPLDPRAVDAFLVYQAVPAPMTVFEGVEHLPPAHAARYHADSGTLLVTPYWDVSYARKVRVSEGEALEEIERLLRRAVRSRLVSDVPLGTFLSGGVDSGLVTTLAAEESRRPIDAVTLGFDDPDYDERAHARVVADRCGALLHEFVLGPDALQELPAILAQYGQPLADVSVLPTFAVARAARSLVTVVLNGDGGDELFAGYARPVVAKAAATYRRWVPEFVRRRVGSAPAGGRLGTLLKAGTRTARDAFAYDRALGPWRSVAYDPAFRAGLERDPDWHPAALYAQVWDHADGVDDVDRALYGDFRTYLPDQLLVKMDTATMAHSLEARSPLLDTALIEFAASLPTSLRIPGYSTKHLLKHLAARKLPPDMVSRAKRGFVPPAGRWLGRDFAGHTRAALEPRTSLVRRFLRSEWLDGLLARDPATDRAAAELLWTVFTLELWLRLEAGQMSAADSLDRLLAGRPSRSGERAQQPVEPAATQGHTTARSSLPDPPPPTGPEPFHTIQIGMGWFPETPGGLNRVFYELVHHLPRQGVHVTGLVEAIKATAGGVGWSVRSMNPEDARPPRGLLARRATIGSVLRQPHHVVAAHFAASAWPGIDLVRRPCVMHFQGPWALESRVEGAPNWKAALQHRLERSVYRRCSRFIVLSEAFGRILAEAYGVSPEAIRVVPPGVDVERFAPSESRDGARRRLGWPTGRPTLVCVRRLARRMGLEHLIAAIEHVRRRIPEVLLVVVGAGALRPVLDDQVAALGLQQSVLFAGRIADDLLPTAYRAADLSVIPTVALEGFGLVITESWASGTPVIGTPVGGISEALRPFSPDLICDSPGVGDLGERIVSALEGQIPVPSSQECVAHATRVYAWPAVARRVAEVYREATRLEA